MKEQRQRQQEHDRRTKELLRTIGPPTHFTIEELDAAIIRVRDKRLRREAEKRRRRAGQHRIGE